jgi:dihydrofolate reductase
MCLNIIVATDNNGGFSKDGSMPWNIKNELQYFKSITLHNIIVMGRKTFETLGNKPLPDRDNIIISSTLLEKKGYYKVYKSIPLFLEDRRNEKKQDVYFIGGKEIYEYAMKNLDITFIYKTVIHKNYECDLFFPDICSYKFTNINSPITFSQGDVLYHHELYRNL